MPECKACEHFLDVGRGPRNQRCTNKKFKGGGRLSASVARATEDLCGAAGREYVGPADAPAPAPKKKKAAKKKK